MTLYPYLAAGATLALAATLSPGEAVAAATANQWLTDPATAAAANASQAGETGASLSTWATWSAAGLGVLIGVAKLLPSSNPLVALLTNLAGRVYDVVVHKDQRAIEARQVEMANGVICIVDLIEELPNEGTIGDLKKKFAGRLPGAVRDAINQRLAEKQNHEV